MINEWILLILVVTKDNLIFPIFECIFLLLIIFAVYKEFSRKRSGLALKRGSESWQNLAFTYGVLSIILIELINSVDFVNDYKTILILLNLSALLYLCFYNDWFRNKVVGIIQKSKDKIENLG